MKQLHLVLAWMTIHEDELYAAWNKAVRNEPFGEMIEPRRQNMYIINGIVYAGEPKQPVKVESVRPLDDWKLRLRFSQQVK